jgi:hypothetical protein
MLRSSRWKAAPFFRIKSVAVQGKLSGLVDHTRPWCEVVQRVWRLSLSHAWYAKMRLEIFMASFWPLQNPGKLPTVSCPDLRD